MAQSDTPPSASAAIILHVGRTPAGWRITGAERLAMSTIYLSQDAALTQARALADAMQRHGQPATVVVDPDPLPE